MLCQKLIEEDFCVQQSPRASSAVPTIKLLKVKEVLLESLQGKQR